MNLRDRIAGARTRLAAAGIESAEAGRDAAMLARHLLNWDRATLYANHDDTPTQDFLDRFDAVVERRARREPVAYIRGVQEFWNREFEVNPAVLIPRPETELIIEQLLARLPLDAPARPRRIADIGTGSGCLAVTAATERASLEVVATDISKAALNVARDNARRYGVSDRIAFRESAYLIGSTGVFDFIMSNPPYVTESEYQALAPEVREYEPASALVAGEDGFRDIRQVVDLSTAYLTPGGTLLIEIGYQHADAVVDLVMSCPALRLVEICNDLQNIPRVAVIDRKIV